MTLRSKHKDSLNKSYWEQDLPNCDHCGLDRTSEGHDGCIGTLPNVTNACCGHGGNAEGAYVQFSIGNFPLADNALRDEAALEFIHREEKMGYKLTDGDIALEGPHGEDSFTLHLASKGFGGVTSLQSFLVTRETVEHLHALLGQRLAESKPE